MQPCTSVKRICLSSRVLGGDGWLYSGIAAAVVIFLASGKVCASTPTSRPWGSRQGFPGGGETTGIAWQMLAATLVILFIGVVAIVVVKKLLPRLAKSRGRRISVLETAYLGPHKSVHLLQVGDRKVLVGSSRDSVVKLGDVTAAFAGDYAEVARGVEAGEPHAAVAVAASSNQPGMG
jgi:flagellar biogenesis protein FliO